MIELADFEVDLGELGIPVQSEAEYRFSTLTVETWTLAFLELYNQPFKDSVMLCVCVRTEENLYDSTFLD